MMTDLFLLILICCLAWLWIIGQKAREIALACARRACRAENLQLLDDTIILSAVRPGRDAHGRLCAQRSYTFEFSITGDERISGHIVLCGHELKMLDFGTDGTPPPDLPLH